MPDLDRRWSRTASVDAIGLNAGGDPRALGDARPRARWTGDEADAPAAVVAALKHPSAGVRRNAVQVLPRGREGRPTRSWPPGCSTTPTRRSGSRRCWRWPTLPPSRRGRLEARRRGRARRARSSGDRWLADAADRRRGGARPATSSKALRRAAKAPRPGDGRSCRRRRRVAEHYAAGRAGRHRSARSCAASRAADARRRATPSIAGLAKGWPKGQGRRSSTPTPRRRSPRCCRSSRPSSRGQMLGPRLALGRRRGSTRYVAELAEGPPRRRPPTTKATEAARVDAARQLIELRKADPQAARDAARPGHGEDAARARERPDRRRRRGATRPRSARPWWTRWGR